MSIGPRIQNKVLGLRRDWEGLKNFTEDAPGAMMAHDEGWNWWKGVPSYHLLTLSSYQLLSLSSYLLKYRFSQVKVFTTAEGQR